MEDLELGTPEAAEDLVILQDQVQEVQMEHLELMVKQPILEVLRIHLPILLMVVAAEELHGIMVAADLADLVAADLEEAKEVLALLVQQI
jgi:hypothetical protein